MKQIRYICHILDFVLMRSLVEGDNWIFDIFWVKKGSKKYCHLLSEAFVLVTNCAFDMRIFRFWDALCKNQKLTVVLLIRLSFFCVDIICHLVKWINEEAPYEPQYGLQNYILSLVCFKKDIVLFEWCFQSLFSLLILFWIFGKLYIDLGLKLLLYRKRLIYYINRGLYGL